MCDYTLADTMLDAFLFRSRNVRIGVLFASELHDFLPTFFSDAGGELRNKCPFVLSIQRLPGPRGSWAVLGWISNLCRLRVQVPSVRRETAELFSLHTHIVVTGFCQVLITCTTEPIKSDKRLISKIKEPDY